MILSKPLIRAVLEQRKTQHRQPRPGALTPGKTVAVRPPGQPGDGTRIRILDTREQRLGDITFTEARAEGFKTTDDFKQAWVRRHEALWTERLADDDPAPALLARFGERHADRTVTVIEFELDTTEQPRLIAAGWPDYTTSAHLAAKAEPEALSDTDHQRHVASRAGMTAAQYVALEKARFDREVERMSLGRRLDKAIEDARREGRQVTREVRVIEQRLRALENQRRAA